MKPHAEAAQINGAAERHDRELLRSQVGEDRQHDDGGGFRGNGVEQRLTVKATNPIVAGEPWCIRPSKAARLLDMSVSKFYQLIAAGEVRTIRVAGMLRVTRSELRRLLGEPTEDGNVQSLEVDRSEN